MTDKAPAPESDESTSTRSTRKEDLARAKAIRKSQARESLQEQSARGSDDHTRAQRVDTASPARPQEIKAPATSNPTLWVLGSLGVLAALLAIAVSSNHGVSTNQAPPTGVSGSDPIAVIEMQPEGSTASEAAGAQPTTDEMAGVGTDASAASEATRRHHTTAFEDALSLDRTSEDFYAAIDASVEKLVADRAIPAAPLIRADYTSYYQPVSSEFLGSSIAIFEHEYFEEYIGCCVNAGLSLILRGPATPEVQAFAERQNCALKTEDDIYLPQEVKDSFGSDESLATELTEISCKENDTYQ